MGTYTFGKLRINCIHIYAYLNHDQNLKSALEADAEIKTDLEGHSPFFYALNRGSQNCIDVMLNYMNSLKYVNMETYLNFSNAIRNDFEELLRNYSVYLPEFLEEIFYTVTDAPNFAVPKVSLPNLFYSDYKKINLSDFIIELDPNSGVSAEEIPIEFKTLPFRIPFNGGSAESILLLKNITTCPNRKILQTKFIRSYIEQKWSDLWYFILFLTIVMWTNIILMSIVIVEIYIYSWTTVVASDFYLYILAFLISNFILAFYEIFQASTTGLSYFLEFWNFIDIFRSSLCIGWGILSFQYSQEDLFIMTWIMVVLNFFRGLTGFRAFDTTRYYTRLIIRAFNDSISFLFIFFYSTFAFGVIYFVSMEGTEQQVFTLWSSPYQLNMGEIEDSHKGPATYLYFMLASVINVIIMLNLLISILGDSFDSFQMDASQINCLEMAELALEIESLMFWKRSLNEKRFMQICQAVQGEESQEWEGKVKMLAGLIKSMRNEVRDDMKIIMKEIKAISRK